MSETKYYGRLFPVEVGQLISVVGKACNDPQRFDIELTTANARDDNVEDVHLHISVRFDELVVVRNSRASEEWGEEEIDQNLLPNNNSSNPFKLGGDFKVDIFVDEEVFFITIDEKPFCTFKHRLTVGNIQVIKVLGDVEAVYQVNQKTAQERPWPAVNVNTFESIAPGQFNPGNIIIITAVPRGDGNGYFTVNLFDGSNRLRTHFQLLASMSDQTFGLSSNDEKGNWREEVAGSHPFVITEAFKLAIAMKNEEFQVAINGEKINATWAYTDHHERLFGSLTGITVESHNGLYVQVQGVDFKRLPEDCTGFERFSKL